MSWMPRTDDEHEYALAPTVAFCRECGCEISAEVAAENDGRCVVHASGNVWRESDDFRW